MVVLKSSFSLLISPAGILIFHFNYFQIWLVEIVDLVAPLEVVKVMAAVLVEVATE
jgi:hypothetical protein